jgi:2-polyprenyl-3-methyl-5-hydroxy-6-metoxy-1,4-benzoquinol methylase
VITFLSSRYWFPDLSLRSDQEEAMEEETADPIALRHTLRQFHAINLLFSRIRGLTRRYIFRDIGRRRLRKVRLLDLGAGAGDFAGWFIASCRRRGVEAGVVCLDRDPRALSFAREALGAHPAVEFVRGDAGSVDIAAFNAHYVVANHFLHHLTDEAIPGQIEKAYQAASCGILINDLLRSAKAHAAFTLAAGLLFRKG